MRGVANGFAGMGRRAGGPAGLLLTVVLLVLSWQVSTLYLNFVPLYPRLALRFGEGGALGIPGTPERLTARGSLVTGAFNRYMPVHPAREAVEMTRFSARLLIGDYVLFLHGIPDGRMAGVRFSADERIPSAFLEFEGERAIACIEMDIGALRPDSPHAIEGWVSGRTLGFRLDGKAIDGFPFEAGEGIWVLASGLRGTRVIGFGAGAETGETVELDPWAYKAWARLLICPLVFLLFGCLLFRGVSAGKGVYALVTGFLCWLLWRDSPALLLIVPVAVGSIAVISVCLATLEGWRFLRLRRLDLVRWRNLVPVVVLTGLSLAYQPLKYSSFGLGQQPLPEEMGPPGLADPCLPGAAAKKVAVFGGSTAAGTGLTDPGRERFSSLLCRSYGGRIAVEFFPHAGAKMTDVLEAEARALSEPLDLVLLYFTFNEALYTHAHLLRSLVARQGFRVWGSVNDTAALMRENHAVDRSFFEESLRTFIRRAREKGARVLLVGEVAADCVMPRNASHGIRLYHESMRRVAREEGAYYLDVTGDFMARRDDLLFVDVVHLNAYGHGLLADWIAPALDELLFQVPAAQRGGGEAGEQVSAGGQGPTGEHGPAGGQAGSPE